MTKNFKTNNKNFILLLTVISIFIFMLSIIFYSKFNDHSYSLLDKTYYHLKDNWTLSTSDIETITTIDLPVRLQFKNNTEYTFSKTLDSTYSSNCDKLLILTGFSKISVYIDNKLIYDFYDSDFDEFNNKAKTKLHLVTLPEKIDNSRLEIKGIILNNSTLSYSLYPPILGSTTSIFHYVIKDQSINMIVIFLTGITSLFLLVIFIISLISKKDNANILFFISIFSLLSFTYSFSESNIIQLIIPNLFIINTMTFMSLLILPVPVLYIMIEYMNPRYTRPLFITIYVLLANFFVQTIFNIFKIRDYRSMLAISHLLVIVTVCVVIYTYIKSWNNKSLNERYFFISITPTILGVIIDMLIYYLKIPIYTGIFFQISILIFTTFHIWSTFQNYINYSTISLQSDLYKEMALTDTLTNLENRNAFELKLQELNSSLKLYNSIWCISIDVNYLKLVNDTLGHSAGDRLLVSFSKLIKSTFENYANCYRIGGDEFIIIACNLSKNDIVDLIDILKYRTKQFNTLSDLTISFAIGYDNYKILKDVNLSDAIIRSDKLMYENKMKIKKEKAADSSF